jgi:hypothetical protein
MLGSGAVLHLTQVPGQHAVDSGLRPHKFEVCEVRGYLGIMVPESSRLQLLGIMALRLLGTKADWPQKQCAQRSQSAVTGNDGTAVTGNCGIRVPVAAENYLKYVFVDPGSIIMEIHGDTLF